MAFLQPAPAGFLPEIAVRRSFSVPTRRGLCGFNLVISDAHKSLGPKWHSLGSTVGRPEIQAFTRRLGRPGCLKRVFVTTSAFSAQRI
jgi:hypothetical protein